MDGWPMDVEHEPGEEAAHPWQSASKPAQAKLEGLVFGDGMQDGIKADFLGGIENSWNDRILCISREDHCSLGVRVELIQEGLQVLCCRDSWFGHEV